MQPYRTVCPHDPAECPDCARTGRGHPQCQAPGCDELAAAHTLRHATQAEYDALPEELKPIDGIARMVVLACEDHADTIDAHCVHAPVSAAACGKCGATGDQPCRKADGSARDSWHRARFPALPLACRHAHSEDCEVFGGCACSANPVTPARTPRVVAPVETAAQTSGLKIPLPIAKTIVEGNDIPWWSVRALDNRLTQDNRPALGVTHAVIDAEGNVQDDGHGHEATAETIIPLDPSVLPARFVTVPPPPPGR